MWVGIARSFYQSISIHSKITSLALFVRNKNTKLVPSTYLIVAWVRIPIANQILHYANLLTINLVNIKEVVFFILNDNFSVVAYYCFSLHAFQMILRKKKEKKFRTKFMLGSYKPSKRFNCGPRTPQ